MDHLSYRLPLPPFSLYFSFEVADIWRDRPLCTTLSKESNSLNNKKTRSSSSIKNVSYNRHEKLPEIPITVIAVTAIIVTILGWIEQQER